MTALSLVYPVQNLINAVAIGFGVGINAVIAYHLGARQQENASVAATHGTALSALHGLVLTAVCIPLMPWFLGMFTDDRTVIELGSQYAGIAFSFSVVIMVSLSFEKIYQAVGRMKETMLALLSGCITNIVLDPMLIFGIGPFPQIGDSRGGAGHRHRAGGDAGDLPCHLPHRQAPAAAGAEATCAPTPGLTKSSTPSASRRR